MTSGKTPRSVLVLGATGRTGLEIVRQLAHHKNKPAVHAFCRNPKKLSSHDTTLCASVLSGDARSSEDLHRAVEETNADVVVVCVGNGDGTKKTDIRTASAQALVDVLKKSPYHHVRVVVVSSNGARKSRIIVGMGIGKLISYHLRYVLADHTGQEAAFETMNERTVVIRPTSLTDGKAKGKFVEFGDKEKPRTIKIDRSDVAAYAVEEICGKTTSPAGKVVNITGYVR
uniref:NAD(P)-binding domain-containing protein n=1 Tax=Trieres chinensis TaxID=1514140 RepID=A0A7S2EVM8_TRICV|mmetsp:Transcript_4887/g.10289  ORF Transcript_4887/g.10289 Transcript_4887/m.10289 type:complete len:229 (+) Transcript_4887:76-762(+)|eukprot:CAMPEP_0183310824 /NCGR_PEP_ID=MMETSP0160_2-20130417/33525_1 /TAXON_ID=2839 ORGANISM="Odontella Sinensis, Strain Grunow 1884" /NCGR_SAMPLE_ID=MMETSP0160_2 /ASSEMBLY_ACC=CAM_ASM_000250 /LENGTH=228 /DNA_ID=CAMNT_0025475209 /DNA_START=65 /DNA_END=751 /DNA_ORIENTATION=+